MSILDSLIGPALAPHAASPADRDAGDDFWFGDVDRQDPYTGKRVTPATAMGVTMVYICIRVLARTYGTTPILTYRSIGQDEKERAKDHSLYNLLRHKPNPWQTAQQWKMLHVRDIGLRGAHYSNKVFNRRGEVEALIPHHPDDVTPELLPNNRMRYRVIMPDRTIRFFVQEEMLHLFLELDEDGVTGLSPIRANMQEISLTEAAREHAARFYRNNARPAAVIEVPPGTKDQARQELKRSFMAKHGGVGNAWSLAVLNQGMTYKPIGITPEESQYIETRKNQNELVAAIYGVQPHKVGLLDRATNNNIEVQNREFLQDSMLPWFVNFEQSAWIKLFEDGADGFFAEFLLDQMLRADFKTRWEGYKTGLTHGVMSPDEVRAKENMNPRPDGQGGFYYDQLNLVRSDEDRATVRAKQKTPAPGQRDPDDEPDDDEEEEDENEDGTTARVLNIHLEDAAGRVARSEGAEVAKLIDKHRGKPADFVEAFRVFHVKHKAYFEQALGSVSDAYILAAVPHQELEKLYGGYVRHATRLIQSDPKLSLHTWVSNRTEWIQDNFLRVEDDETD